MTMVLDASAVLAYLNAEDGDHRVAEALDDAVISAANWAEVLQKVAAAGGDVDRIGTGLRALGVEIEPLTAEDGPVIATLWPHTRTAGLSLGDRACLATAQRLQLAALTADQAWKGLDLAIEVELIR